MRRPIAARAALAILTLVVACDRGAAPDTGASTAVTSSKPAPLPDRLGIGHAPDSARLAAIDIDANPAGVGLPAGHGTSEEGRTIFAAKCASCHGAKGEGQATYPKLIAAAADSTFRFGNDVKLAKTIGNYWPYSTTVYDYVHRTMPLTAPGSLQPNEVYGLVAYLLAENGVVPQGFVADAASLPKVKMPAHDRFVADDRTGGATFR